MKSVRTELTKADVERLFIAAADDALAERDSVRLRARLDDDSELRGRFEKYQKTIALLKKTPKERAPDSLASVIMRRVRRRRLWGRNSLHTFHMQYRVPVEVLIPILLGVLVAAFLFFAAP
jgi:anti-sigma factor RsiW